jgi:hypothetical protein
MHTKFWKRNLKGRDWAKDLGADRKIISECILVKQGQKVWTGFIWLRIEIGVGCCEHGNEPLGSIQGSEFFD